MKERISWESKYKAAPPPLPCTKRAEKEAGGRLIKRGLTALLSSTWGPRHLLVPSDYRCSLSLNVRSWFGTYRASFSMSLFIRINFLCTILYLLSHILIFTPTHFGIHWCRRQGFQSYCGLFLRHPNGENEIAIWRCWEQTAVKTDIPEDSISGFRKAMEWKIVCDLVHTV